MKNPTKQCTKCGKEKLESEFNKNNQQKSGLTPSCKACIKIGAKIHYEKYKKEISKQHSKYYKLNKQTIVECVKKWQKENPEKVKSYKKKCSMKPKTKQLKIISTRKRIKQLSSDYVKTVICSGTCLNHADIPNIFVETKREIIKNHRIIKEY